MVERAESDADSGSCHDLPVHLRDDTRTNSTTTLTNSKPQTLLHSHRLNQLNRQLNIIPRHNHLNITRQRHNPSHISRPKIKLRTIPRKKRRMPTPLTLRQNISRTLKRRMRRNRTRLRQHLTPLNIITPHTPQQNPHIIPSNTRIKRLPMHLNTSNNRLHSIPKTNNLNLITSLHNTTLNPTSRNRTPTSNRKNILNRHQKRLINITLRRRNIRINRIQQLPNTINPLILTTRQIRRLSQHLQRLQRRTRHHRNIITRKLIRRQKLTHLHLQDRKSTRLNSSHVAISYAVFC